MANPYVKQTWTDGSSSASAARLGVLEQGIYDAHFAPAARVLYSANVSITTAVPTVLLFNSELIDQDGLGTSTIHDTVTNTSRLTCRVAGFYQIIAQVEWAANATGYRSTQILLNGSSVIAEVIATSVSAATSEIQNVPTMYPLAVNDYVEVRVTQASGGALNVLATPSRSPEFMMVRVA